MDPVEKADALKAEADFLLQEIGLAEMLAAYGRQTPTGSYFLGLMAYPDIDWMAGPQGIGTVFEIGRQLAEKPRVWSIVFEKTDDPQMEGGLYLKARLRYGNWGRLWKIDIWFLNEALIERRTAEMAGFLQRLSPDLRRQILAYKNSILTPELRTPTYSGYFIYKAFLDEGLSDPALVTEYLRKNGIKL